MREKQQKQMPLMDLPTGHPKEIELEMMSKILDETSTIYDHVLQDLNGGLTVERNRTGANGMSAEQVTRAAIVMKLYSFTYEDLAFHTSDSRSIRRFCRIGIFDKGFKKSTLHQNINRLSPETWELIGLSLLAYAKDNDIEKGRKARVDCTVVESNIHPPCDSMQLYDSVRVLTRLLTQARDDFNIKIVFTDHCRRAKRRMTAIQYANGDKQRLSPYKDLLKVTQKTIGYATKAEEMIGGRCAADFELLGILNSIKHYADLARQVYDQTYRRFIQGENVPASQKVLSIFEEHTDIIIKDRRQTYYGHKICLTGGASNLILDCVILEGNPADSTLVEHMLDRQNEVYGRYPLKVAFDGGFASKANLAIAKAKGVKDVCFAKKRGLEEADMCRSHHVYNKLCQFRAGIESGISWLKRSFGLTRCTWKGFRSFKSFVLSSVVAANLLTIARKQLAAVG